MPTRPPAPAHAYGRGPIQGHRTRPGHDAVEGIVQCFDTVPIRIGCTGSPTVDASDGGLRLDSAREGAGAWPDPWPARPWMLSWSHRLRSCSSRVTASPSRRQGRPCGNAGTAPKRLQSQRFGAAGHPVHQQGHQVQGSLRQVGAHQVLALAGVIPLVENQVQHGRRTPSSRSSSRSGTA